MSGGPSSGQSSQKLMENNHRSTLSRQIYDQRGGACAVALVVSVKSVVAFVKPLVVVVRICQDSVWV